MVTPCWVVVKYSSFSEIDVVVNDIVAYEMSVSVRIGHLVGDMNLQSWLLWLVSLS